MAKISKTQIIFIVCFILLFSLQNLVIEPIVKEKYLYDDLKYFKNNSWKYPVSIFIIIAAILIFKIRKSLTMYQIPGIILTLIFIATSFYFGGHNFIDNTLLYLNSKIEGLEIIKTYKVISYKENETFWLNSTESVHDKNDLENINKSRIRKNLKSIFEYQNNDTVKVRFNKGLINVNYLK